MMNNNINKYKTKEVGTMSFGYNLKFFGDMINGMIHSLKVFEFEKTGEYKFKSTALYAASYPVFYLFYRLDDAISVGGCTLVAELRKN